MRSSVVAFLALGLVLSTGALAQLAATTDSAPAVRAAKPLEVVDANGKVMGRYGNSSVYVPVNGVLTEVYLSAYRSTTLLTYDVDQDVAFVSSDCTGTPYILNNPAGVTPSAVFSGNGQIYLYLASSNEGTKNIVLSSYVGGDGTLNCHSTGGFPFDIVWPSNAPIDITVLFKPPFALR